MGVCLLTMVRYNNHPSLLLLTPTTTTISNNLGVLGTSSRKTLSIAFPRPLEYPKKIVLTMVVLEVQTSPRLGFLGQSKSSCVKVTIDESFLAFALLSASKISHYWRCWILLQITVIQSHSTSLYILKFSYLFFFNLKIYFLVNSRWFLGCKLWMVMVGQVVAVEEWWWRWVVVVGWAGGDVVVGGGIYLL